MINTGKKARSTAILIILSIILIAITISLWLLFSGKDTQQDKTYSGAKLVEQRQDYVSDWGIL